VKKPTTRNYFSGEEDEYDLSRIPSNSSRISNAARQKKIHTDH
jgi:hypothetical protein